MLEIREGVFWTGAIDWNLRMFHGYSIPAGTTYNAYLLRDELPTLIDTVKHYGFPEMLGRIREVIDPREIRYIVSNHTEMDHSGAIDRLLQYCPEAEVVCSPRGPRNSGATTSATGASGWSRGAIPSTSVPGACAS